MCIIIDTNISAEIFHSPSTGNYEPLLSWIFKKDGRVIYGEKLGQELFNDEKIRKLFRVLSNAGKARKVSEANELKELKRIGLTTTITSDDGHIIALARASRARILCTKDKKLIVDFTNKDLLNPKGKVYKRKEHFRLLGHFNDCKK